MKPSATWSVAFAIGAACWLASPANATDVTVRVSGVVGAAGLVRVAVCLPTEYESAHCRFKANGAAQPGDVAVTIHDVTPGRYAIIAHHDRRGDGVVKKNWLGIPVDGVGVSRNVQGFFGPPAFDRVAIDVAGAAVTVPITLKQEPGE